MSDASRPRQGLSWHRRGRHALKHSLRVRLIALFLLLALAMSAAFISGMQKALSMGWRQAALPLLNDYVDHLTADIGTPPSIEKAQALVQRLPVSVKISGPVINWDSHPTHRQQRWNSPHDHEHERPLERSLQDGHHLEFGLGDLAFSERPQRIAWVTLLILLLLTAFAYLWVRRMLKPLDDIRAGAARFGSGQFDAKIPVRRKDELGDLAAQINTMADEIHQMLEGKRALLLAISHELRSPLTRARLNTELLAESAANAPLRLALLRDLGEMRDLITDLLESERLAGGHAALSREPTDVCELVRACAAADADGMSAEQIPLTLVLDPATPQLNVDPVRLRLVVRNLLDNARRHSQEGARPPAVSVTTVDTHVQITVRDFGSGVAPDQLALLAQAFYRPDTARLRATGGVGLGLYLCRLVTEAHGGSLQFRNAEPGLEVSVNLPLV